jgi:pimeloyl-ACP methyl ester carboxylesterase
MGLGTARSSALGSVITYTALVPVIGETLMRLRNFIIMKAVLRGARYDAAFFTEAVEGFLEKLDLRDITLVGVSIGAVISLIIAGRHNPRVARVISINPYDYPLGMSE